MRFLAPIVSDFMRAHPAVSIELAVGDRMVDVVDEGYDLVIRPVAMRSSGGTSPTSSVPTTSGGD